MRPQITNGYVGSTILPNHWNYTPFQRRDYPDGISMLLEESNAIIAQTTAPYEPRETKVIGTVWVQADGLNGGYHRRYINSPSDIGALYCGFRRGLTQIERYPIYHSNGTRNRGPENNPIVEEGNIRP